jgi:Domain of Unknown Function (DUF1080)
MRIKHGGFVAGGFLLLAFSIFVAAQQNVAPTGYDDTPMQPNGKWHIHDGKRPQPRIVTPGDAAAATPPSDATVLLGPGTGLSKWQMLEGGGPATWNQEAGVAESGKGYIRTRDEFSDFQLHLEWATPSEVKGNSQERGNSGVFLLGKFEVQVLDSFNNITYPDGQAAAMYGQYPPLVNASRKPGEWQAYDIVFVAPRFTGAKLVSPAVVTVFHNGVVVHHGTAYLGPTAHKQILPYTPDLTKGPIALQDHSNPVRFRNIWIRTLDPYDAS